MHRLVPGLFGERSPHLVHPASGFRVWFVEPLGMLTQVGAEREVGVDVARFIAEEAGGELLRRRGLRGDKLLFLHDWVELEGYTPDARRTMTKWGLEMSSSAERIVLALNPRARFVRMGVSVAAVALQLAGFSIEIAATLQPTLDRLGVRPAR